jgi:hypothetical protein
MKVKLFQAVVNVSVGGTDGNFSTMESRINTFLEETPDIDVIDIKLAANAAPVGDGPTNYGLVALLMYEDRK